MDSHDIYNMLERVESWGDAGVDCRVSFTNEMRSRDYGISPLMQAWHWFYFGWTAKGQNP